jgi:transposase InsO family protein
VAESGFATLKTEFYDRHRWATRSEAKTASGRWIEERYSRKRRHSSIGMLTPVCFEKQQLHTAQAA